MMNEVKSKENNEIKNPEADNYKEIKPESGTTYQESKDFWKNEVFVDKVLKG